MPFFPLAGGEIVFLVLCCAIARWLYRSWRSGDLGVETLQHFQTPQAPAEEPPPPEPPRLRLIRGGLDEAPDSGAREHRVGQRRPRP